MNLFMLIYIAHTKSLISRMENYMELFNEFCVMCCTIHINFFTDFMKDEEIKYKLGWQMIVIIFFNIAINLSIVSVMSIK